MKHSQTENTVTDRRPSFPTVPPRTPRMVYTIPSGTHPPDSGTRLSLPHFHGIDQRGGGGVPRTPCLRAAILLAATLLLTACDRGSHPSRIGSPAPAFTLSDGNRNVDLAHLRGHIVIVNFWATWCPPCIEELPSLLALQHDMPQVTVVAISQDEDPQAYAQFLLDNHVTLLTLRDPSARIPRLYGTSKIPESYVIDPQGVLRRKFVSAQNWTSPEILNYLHKL